MVSTSSTKLDAGGIAFDLNTGAACLAGFWTWYAADSGLMFDGVEAAGMAFYQNSFDGGRDLAVAFAIGFETNTVADCLVGGAADERTY